ncbi:transcriptional regulator XRE family [Fusobacterium sp. CAG:439]|nr:transcriptional regulator XRE family [Fusobacterium sp. CAG:439]
MQHKRKKNIDKEKRQILLNAIGEIIHEKREKIGKGILLHSYEYDLSSSSLSLLEKGERDPQITTLWKIVNSLDMSFKEFISLLCKKLPDDFKMTDD